LIKGLHEFHANYEGTPLLNVTIQENVLTQIDNLRTYPVIRAKLRAHQIQIHAWVYKIETGEVFAYNAFDAQFEPLDKQLSGIFELCPC
jgi:carbonic anhydrase